MHISAFRITGFCGFMVQGFMYGLLMMASSLLTAQDAKTMMSQAQSAYEAENWQEAVKYFKVAARYEPLPDKYQLPYGIAAYEAGELDIASNLLAKYISDSKTEISAHLYYAMCKHQQYDFEQATTAYKAFLRFAPSQNENRPAVKAAIRRCETGMRYQRRSTLTFVDNMGQPINSIADEIFPLPSPNYENLLYFATNREGVLGIKRDAAGQVSSQGERKLDVYRVFRTATTWQQPEPMPGLLNTPLHDYIVDFADQGQVIYYFKSPHLQAGTIYRDTFQSMETFGHQKNALRKPLRPENGHINPVFFHDSLVIFAAELQGGFGGLDLYYCKKTAGQWSAPINMGSTINSYFDEKSPFLTADGHRLYYATNNPDWSMGEFDIVQSTFVPEQQQWSPPDNLNRPVNSAGNELSFRLTADGKQAYFTSNRKTGFGGYDLYTAYFKEPVVIKKMAYSDFASYKTSDQSTVAVDSIARYDIQPLYYDDDNDLTAGINAQTLQQVAAILKATPELRLSIQGHADASSTQTLYSLYFSLKRSQIVKTFLMDKGVSEKQLFIQGLGFQYPYALEQVSDRDNPQGRKWNRRMELSFFATRSLPIQISPVEPLVSEFMKVPYAGFANDMNAGLSYRVELAQADGMYQRPEYAALPHIAAEQQPYHQQVTYLAGWHSSFSQAHEHAMSLIKQGFTDAGVRAYINGVPVSKAQAVKFVKNYENLQDYIDN